MSIDISIVKQFQGTPLKHMLGQGPCPFCTSTDAFTMYLENGKKNGYCYSCNTYSYDPDRDLLKAQLHPPGGDPSVSDALYLGRKTAAVHSTVGDSSLQSLSVDDGLGHPIRGLAHRSLSYATCEHFGVRVGVSSTDGETPIYTLFPRYKDGELVGWKKKTLDKNYSASGGSNVDLFNSNNIPPTGKKLYITEGEEDAMSIFQALKENSNLPDWTPACVSLPTGAASAATAITRQLDLINGYNEVVLVFDNDAAGKKARDEVCKILAGKVSYVVLPTKDANEMLMQGKSIALKWAVLSPKKYQPDGFINGKDLWAKRNEQQDMVYYPYPAHMVGLNQKIYGCWPGTVVTLTAGTGSGKTQVLREFMYHFWETTNEKIGGMFLEEGKLDTGDGLAAIHLNKRIQLPNVKVSNEDIGRAYSELFDDGRFEFYDFFGGMDDSTLLGKLRYLAITGHKFIFLDHLSIVVSEFAAEGGEVGRIDTIMTKLAKFAKEFGIVLFLVVHLRKADSGGASFELGAQPSLDDLRGSSSLKQLSWSVLGLARNQQHPDPYCANTTEVIVLKDRRTGRTGIAGYLHFNDNTGRLHSIERPVNYKLKRRSKDGDEEF